jgi:hypothetical protein
VLFAFGFGTDTAWGSKSYGVACLGSSNCRPGFAWTDVNGDGKVDFVYHRSDVDEWRVLLSTGTSFGTDTAWGTKAYGMPASGRPIASQFSLWTSMGTVEQTVYERTGTTEFRAMLSPGRFTDTARGVSLGSVPGVELRPPSGSSTGTGTAKRFYLSPRGCQSVPCPPLDREWVRHRCRWVTGLCRLCGSATANRPLAILIRTGMANRIVITATTQ